jgi:hypothetical protein
MEVDGQRDISATLPLELVLTGAENLARQWNSVLRYPAHSKPY